jgi:HEAT repeat protein
MTVRLRSVLFVGLALVLAGCGRDAPPPLTSHGRTVGEWVESLRSADPKVRKKAVAALGHAGAADPTAVPALVGALKDRDAAVRDAAVLALLNLGAAAREAVPALEAAQKDRDPKVRGHAARAVSVIRGGTG